jgi:hypothetical protein
MRWIRSILVYLANRYIIVMVTRGMLCCIRMHLSVFSELLATNAHTGPCPFSPRIQFRSGDSVAVTHLGSFSQIPLLSINNK